MMQNVMELVQMALAQSPNQQEAAKLLATFGPPPEDYTPKMPLPVQNELPSFSVAQPGIGGVLAGQDHGVVAPIIGQTASGEPSLGELLMGENNA